MKIEVRPHWNETQAARGIKQVVAVVENHGSDLTLGALRPLPGDRVRAEHQWNVRDCDTEAEAVIFIVAQNFGRDA